MPVASTEIDTRKQQLKELVKKHSNLAYSPLKWLGNDSISNFDVDCYDLTKYAPSTELVRTLKQELEKIKAIELDKLYSNLEKEYSLFENDKIQEILDLQVPLDDKKFDDYHKEIYRIDVIVRLTPVILHALAERMLSQEHLETDSEVDKKLALLDKTIALIDTVWTKYKEKMPELRQAVDARIKKDKPDNFANAKNFGEESELYPVFAELYTKHLDIKDEPLKVIFAKRVEQFIERHTGSSLR